MKHTKKILFLLIISVTIIVVLLGYFTLMQKQNKDKPPQRGIITSFEECIAAGNPVMESYPRQCRTLDGKYFVEKIVTGNGTGNDPRTAKADLIRIKNIVPNQYISSPLTITGEARGTWFFEASFPITITDWDGRIVAQHYAMTADEWMTQNFVSYTSTVEFENPSFPNVEPKHFSTRGALILQKDNPSGLPKHDDALELPIRFALPGYIGHASEQLGITLQYPIEMNISYEAPDALALVLLGPTQSEGTEVYDGMIISFNKKPFDNLTLQQAAEKERNDFALHGDGSTASPQAITLSDYNGYTFEGTGLGTFTFYILPLDSEHYLFISVLLEDPAKQGFEESKEVLLNSLQILDF